MIPSYRFHRPRNISEALFLILFLFLSTLQINESMRVHPLTAKRNMAIRSDFNSSAAMERNTAKKLRKLPHVFSKVLELPFKSDADVAIEEGPDFFRFVAEIEVDGDESPGKGIGAHAVEIHPGVVKIVIRKDDNDLELTLDKLEIDTWRFRLPPSTQPELANAVFVDGELIVTVPKDMGLKQFPGGSNVLGGSNHLVVVQ